MAASIPLIIAGVASAVVSSALAPKPDGGGGMQMQAPAAAPTVAPVPTMPVADDKAVEEAKRRSIASQLARQGRASTILTGDVDAGSTLG